MAGRVRVDGRLVTKAGTAIAADAALEVEQGPAYVSRGGDKLATALAAFAIDVSGLVCLDVGASTGGFTDCLLQRGAAHVTALDVGRGQLHERLRQRRPRDAAWRASTPACWLPAISPARRLRSPSSMSRSSPSRSCCRRSSGVLAHPYRAAAAREAAVRGRARRGARAASCATPPSTRRCSSASRRRRARPAASCSAPARAAIPGPAGNREFFLHIVSSDHPEAAGAPGRPATAAARCRRLSASACAAWRCIARRAAGDARGARRAPGGRGAASSCCRERRASRRPTS